MTGTTLDAFDYVPRAVLEQLGHQFGMSAQELTTLRALYRRQMTLFLHQRWACEYAGFHRHGASDVTHVIESLLADSSVTLDRHRLARQTREVLFARHRLIPGERDIEDWVRRAIHLVELQDRRYLDEVVPAKVRDNWLNQLMREKYPEPMTVLEWLRRPPRRRTRQTLDEEISKWLAIRAMTPPKGRIYRAGHALGQLLRTVYLCANFTLPDFRRPLYRLLERGESMHALERQICTQPLPAKRGRRTEELMEYAAPATRR